MNNVTLFEEGKTYKGTYGTYTIVKRTKCFVTLKSGARYKISREWSGKEAFFFKRNVSYWGAIFKELEGVFSTSVVED
jgi:hypothetical protein